MPEDDEKTTIEAGADTEVGEGVAASGDGKKKLVLFGGIGLGAIVVGVTLALFVIRPMMAGDGDPGQETREIAESLRDGGDDSRGDGHGDDHRKERPRPKSSGGTSLVYAVRDIVVNPAGTGGSRFLSASFALEVQASWLEKELAEKDAMVRDALITILSSKTVPQLTDPKQKEVVRYQIRKRLQQLLNTEDITNVYFTDFVLQ